MDSYLNEITEDKNTLTRAIEFNELKNDFLFLTISIKQKSTT